MCIDKIVQSIETNIYLNHDKLTLNLSSLVIFTNTNQSVTIGQHIDVEIDDITAKMTSINVYSNDSIIM
jgi:hypothetical protein